jgi:hypothetical protein
LVGMARIGVLGRTFASFAIPIILSRKARNPKGVRGWPALLAAAACAARTSMLSKNGSAASTRRSSAPLCAGENIAEYSEASRSHRRPSRAMRLRSIFNCCGVGRIDSLAMSLVACETQYARTCRSIGFPSALSSLWSSASDNGRISGFGFGRMNWSLAGDDGGFLRVRSLYLEGHFLPTISRRATRASFSHFPYSRNDRLRNHNRLLQPFCSCRIVLQSCFGL